MAKPPVSRILPGAAKVAIRGVPVAGEAVMAVDGTLQAVRVMKEQREMDKRLRERRRASQGLAAKARSVLDATKERLTQQLTGTARIAAAAFTGVRTNPDTGVRTNPEKRDNGTLAVMFRNIDEGEIEVVLYDTAKLAQGAEAAFIGYIFANCSAYGEDAPVNGCHWRIQLSAARRGYGPLLYTTTATMLNTNLYASTTLSADAVGFWRRQGKSYIAPLPPEAFKARFGVTVPQLLKRSTATRGQTFDMRAIGQREVSRVYGSQDEVDRIAATETGKQAAVYERRRWELNDDRAPLRYINEEAQEYAREDWRRKTQDNPLVGWETNKVRPSEVHSIYRILTGPRSEEYYKNAFRNVPFDIRVVVQLPATPEDPARYRAAVEAKQVVLVVNRPLPLDFAVGEKYDRLHFARYTPFMLLHRVFDEVCTGPKRIIDRDLRDHILEYMQHVFGLLSLPDTLPEDTISEHDVRRWFPDYKGQRGGLWSVAASLGVDTAAGRNGACGDGGQALADLFAKYCLTGKIAFNPYILPPGVSQEDFAGGNLHKLRRWIRISEGGASGNREDLHKLRRWLRIREGGAKSMKGLFDEVIALLQKGQVIYV